MDYRFSFQRPMRRSSFGSMKGTIVDLVPAGQGGFYYVVSGNDGNLLVSQ